MVLRIVVISIYFMTLLNTQDPLVVCQAIKTYIWLGRRISCMSSNQNI